MSIQSVSVYTDGSASFKVGNGAWSFVAKKGEAVAELFEYFDKTTIGEMELTAIKRSLEWLPLGTAPIRIFSDSQYAVNAVNVWGVDWRESNWMIGGGRRPANWKVIRDVMKLMDEHRKTRAVTLVWLPGHRKHPFNERADVLAGTARKEKLTNWTPLVAAKSD